MRRPTLERRRRRAGRVVERDQRSAARGPGAARRAHRRRARSTRRLPGDADTRRARGSAGRRGRAWSSSGWCRTPRSRRSSSATDSPREAASSATPAPVMPPPTTTTSTASPPASRSSSRATAASRRSWPQVPVDRPAELGPRVELRARRARPGTNPRAISSMPADSTSAARRCAPSRRRAASACGAGRDGDLLHAAEPPRDVRQQQLGVDVEQPHEQRVARRARATRARPSPPPARARSRRRPARRRPRSGGRTRASSAPPARPRGRGSAGTGSSGSRPPAGRRRSSSSAAPRPPARTRARRRAAGRPRRSRDVVTSSVEV